MLVFSNKTDINTFQSTQVVHQYLVRHPIIRLPERKWGNQVYFKRVNQSPPNLCFRVRISVRCKVRAKVKVRVKEKNRVKVRVVFRDRV